MSTPTDTPDLADTGADVEDPERLAAVIQITFPGFEPLAGALSLPEGVDPHAPLPDEQVFGKLVDLEAELYSLLRVMIQHLRTQHVERRLETAELSDDEELSE